MRSHGIQIDTPQGSRASVLARLRERRPEPATRQVLTCLSVVDRCFADSIAQRRGWLRSEPWWPVPRPIVGRIGVEHHPRRTVFIQQRPAGWPLDFVGEQAEHQLDLRPVEARSLRAAPATVNLPGVNDGSGRMRGRVEPSLFSGKHACREQLPLDAVVLLAHDAPSCPLWRQRARARGGDFQRQARRTTRAQFVRPDPALSASPSRDQPDLRSCRP